MKDLMNELKDAAQLEEIRSSKEISVALFSGLLFVLNWKVMSCNYREYGGYLGLASLLTAIISIALIIFVGEITQTDSGDRASFQQERQTDTGFDETGAEL